MNDRLIKASEVLRAQLAHSLGLDSYAQIMCGNPTSPEFQRLFNGYYRVRRDKKWREHYYRLFLNARENRYTFEQIITELFDKTKNVEASFSSKMLATIDASKPVWDQYVLMNLGLELKGKSREEKLQNAIALYKRIEVWYADYLVTSEARENIEVFNFMLPEYSWLSDTKKIDCLLWIKRK